LAVAVGLAGLCRPGRPLHHPCLLAAFAEGGAAGNTFRATNPVPKRRERGESRIGVPAGLAPPLNVVVVIRLMLVVKLCELDLEMANEGLSRNVGDGLGVSGLLEVLPEKEVGALKEQARHEAFYLSILIVNYR